MSLTTHEPRAIERMPEPANASEGIMTQILRVASDPSIDLDRMDKLMTMHAQLEKNQAARAFAAAFADLQADLPVVIEHGENTNTRAKYATLEDTLDAIRPHLKAHGFSINFHIEQPDGAIAVTGVLRHREGHEQRTTLRLPLDTGPGRSAVQAIGSSETYGRRYVTMALLNIASRKHDDDGVVQIQSPPVSDEQAMQIRELIEASGSNEKRLLTALNVPTVEEIPARKFDDVVAVLQKKAQRR